MTSAVQPSVREPVTETAQPVLPNPHERSSTNRAKTDDPVQTLALVLRSVLQPGKSCLDSQTGDETGGSSASSAIIWLDKDPLPVTSVNRMGPWRRQQGPPAVIQDGRALESLLVTNVELRYVVQYRTYRLNHVMRDPRGTQKLSSTRRNYENLRM